MIELGTCILCGFIGAGIAIVAQKSALNKYFNLVECLWDNDMRRINDRIDEILVERMQNNVVKLSTNSVGKPVNKTR